MKKKSLISLGVILIVILIVVGIKVVLPLYHPITSDEVAKCIGTKATLYTQLGCHACETQEKIFGDSYEFVSVVDCFFEREKCIAKNIQATPTWIINKETYKGTRSIEQLKELTGC